MGARNTRAAGKRDARNKARREQRAAAKQARALAAELQAKQAQPEGDEYLKSGENRVSDTDGCAALPPLPPAPSLDEMGPAVARGVSGHIYGSPRVDPDLRLGRRSVEQPWDPRRVYDVRIVRATDNAVTMVKGLSQQKAEELMLECARWMADLVSIERSPRMEY